MVPAEGFDSPSASPKLHLSKLVLKSRFPCEKPQAFLTPTFLVRPERFELPAYCSEDSRSIQLSYGRLRTDYIR